MDTPSDSPHQSRTPLVSRLHVGGKRLPPPPRSVHAVFRRLHVRYAESNDLARPVIVSLDGSQMLHSQIYSYGSTSSRSLLISDCVQRWWHGLEAGRTAPRLPRRFGAKIDQVIPRFVARLNLLQRV
ncbi:hypothetical protein L915_12383 [Phytophthora nicotianae]|uniref:Uncharacterized protein n=1 Tax=Phytophthora nicotianae TaxID=4792 RepID=W2GIT1_PHYNI|nr:hypothetical protein L915_12383 [Phytophthora nicotianae]